jgi:SAM-dependent methyltransferase
VDKETKNKIKNLVLKLREDFEKEIELGLNRHGIYVDKEWKDGRSLTHLSKQELENRNRIAAFIKRQESAGISRAKATREFIKEASYTWINRLLGLKCMEVRGLLDEEVITTRSEYGGRSLRHRNFREEHPELANAPDDGLIACLFEVFREITEEIKVLFDPNSEYSLIIPRYAFLKQAIDLINNSLDYYTYREDEFLGWVYQYFQTKEKDRIFEEVNKKKKKIAGRDIIPVTTLYTEKYMVKFLVENSLGALWMEMYPDSRLYQNWEYFVKDPNNTTREKKPVKEIKFLDPACGSGHFLLYAFDLFYQMYEEEGIVPRDQIPDHILKYNLYGIDIDLRSIQLTALGLYMKAKTKNPDMKVTHMNLVPADAIMVDGERLKDFLDEFQDDPLAQELIKTLWRGLENVRELGSLLKIEEQIDEVIKRAKSPGLSAKWKEGFAWEKWKQEILEALKRYYDEGAITFDVNKQLFANEAEKGVRLLDLFEQKYDVVATNPPYMNKQNIDDNNKKIFKSLYPHTYFDQFSMFIERCIELARNNGYIAMITQQSFMFIKTFDSFRKKLLKAVTINSVAHLGSHAFEDIAGEKVNTVMFSLIKNRQSGKLSKFIRLVDSYEKDIDLKKGCSDSEILSSTLVYMIPQDNFNLIEGSPFLYWISKDLYDIFKYKSLDKFADIRSGIVTGDNDVYLKYQWEIREIGKRWIPYAKGGDFSKFDAPIEFVIDWSKDAQSHYSGHPHARIREGKYHFREGITYSKISSSGFNARYLSKEMLFDDASSSIFPSSSSNIYYILGLVNSKLISFVLATLNPTLNFQVNDVSRIPIKLPDETTQKKVTAFSHQCVTIKRDLFQHLLTNLGFQNVGIIFAKFQIPIDSKISLQTLYKFYLSHIEMQNIKLQIYDAIINKEIFALYEIDGEDLEQILREQGTPAGFFPIVEGFELIPEDMLPEAKEYIKGLERKQLSAEELNKIGEKLKELYEGGKTLEEISIELQINPVSIAAMRKEADLINPRDLKHEVENLLTYYILEELKKDKNGIIPITDNTAEVPLAKRLIADLEKMFGEENIENILAEVKDILGKDLDRWLSTDFFKKHVSQYKKRPIIWHLQSRRKSFECLLYYHKIDSDMLQKLKNIYLSKALEVTRYRLQELRVRSKDAGGKDKGAINKEIERLEEAIGELEEFESNLELILKKGYDPNIDDGVKVNITPLQEAGILAIKKVV